jgi:hypothetical protein
MTRSLAGPQFVVRRVVEETGMTEPFGGRRGVHLGKSVDRSTAREAEITGFMVFGPQAITARS